MNIFFLLFSAVLAIFVSGGRLNLKRGAKREGKNGKTFISEKWKNNSTELFNHSVNVWRLLSIVAKFFSPLHKSVVVVFSLSTLPEFAVFFLCVQTFDHIQQPSWDCFFGVEPVAVYIKMGRKVVAMSLLRNESR